METALKGCCGPGPAKNNLWTITEVDSATDLEVNIGFASVSKISIFGTHWNRTGRKLLGIGHQTCIVDNQWNHIG